LKLASSAIVTFLEAENLPVFNDLQPELSGRESDEVEARREIGSHCGPHIGYFIPNCQEFLLAS
jgi:hypothetical protein